MVAVQRPGKRGMFCGLVPGLLGLICGSVSGLLNKAGCDQADSNERRDQQQSACGLAQGSLLLAWWGRIKAAFLAKGKATWARREIRPETRGGYSTLVVPLSSPFPAYHQSRMVASMRRGAHSCKLSSRACGRRKRRSASYSTGPRSLSRGRGTSAPGCRHCFAPLCAELIASTRRAYVIVGTCL